MKWLDGLTFGAETERKEKWHPWFAWFPVVVGENSEGRKIKVWLEWVERKGELLFGPMASDYWEYSYRELNGKP